MRPRIVDPDHHHQLPEIGHRRANGGAQAQGGPCDPLTARAPRQSVVEAAVATRAERLARAEARGRQGAAERDGGPSLVVGTSAIDRFDGDSVGFDYDFGSVSIEDLSDDGNEAEGDSSVDTLMISTHGEREFESRPPATHHPLTKDPPRFLFEQSTLPFPDDTSDDPSCGAAQISVPFPGGALPV